MSIFCYASCLLLLYRLFYSCDLLLWHSPNVVIVYLSGGLSAFAHCMLAITHTPVGAHLLSLAVDLLA